MSNINLVTDNSLNGKNVVVIIKDQLGIKVGNEINLNQVEDMFIGTINSEFPAGIYNIIFYEKDGEKYTFLTAKELYWDGNKETNLLHLQNLLEADEEHSQTKIKKKHKTTKEVLIHKNVSGSVLSGPINITENI